MKNRKRFIWNFTCIAIDIAKSDYFFVNFNKTEIFKKNLINAYPVSKCNNAHA